MGTKATGRGTALFADPLCKEHETGHGHPEAAVRFDATLAALEKAGCVQLCQRLASSPATTQELSRCHTETYINLVKQEVAAGADTLSTGDTPLSPGSLDAARASAGQALRAVDGVVTGKVQHAFCLTRPPGHHATSTCGMGFCIFNHVALAARHAQQAHGIGKVLIIDWDVHHGNGTQDIFYEDESVFYFSTHQSPWYPGTGAAHETGQGKGLGTTLNCPLPAGTQGATVLEAVEHKLFDAMTTFRPELILISAGFDSRKHDPLGQFLLSDEDFSDLTRAALYLADTYAGGRIVSVLEGGYNTKGVGLAAAAHLSALLDHSNE